MPPQRLLVIVLLVIPIGLSARPSPPDPGAAAALRARALQFGYNLDYEDAMAAFREAIAADPSHPAGHRLLAAAMWIHILFEQGAVTAEDYLAQRPSATARKPSAEAEAAFRDALNRAMTLAEARRQANPRDADAAFQTGAAFGFLASYTGTVQGRLLAGVRPARRAYEEQKRALALDPTRKDAGLIVGLYRYAIASLSPPMRLLARVVGFEGGRERGIKLVEEAAAYPSDVQTNALFTLIVMYNREARYADALDVIARLQRMYPRNRLLWLEQGSAALRAGRPADARHALEEGLAKLTADPRPRAFGEEARWRYYHGASLVALREIESAERELRLVLTLQAHDWVRGRASLELGKIADLAGTRARAIEAYRTAVRICRADRDSTCSDEASKLMKRAYR